MSNEHILKKIQKCLALSKSSNEHEAAVALRQAKALMDKHKLTMTDVELSQIDVALVEGGYAKPPKWKTMLYIAVATAFSCSSFCYGGRPVFVGQQPNPEIAKYALDVLLRQLEQNKKAFIADFKVKKGTLSKSAMIKLGQGYAEGWVLGCYRVVKQFSSALSVSEQKSHEERIKQHLDLKRINPEKNKKSATESKAGSYAASHGYTAGQKAKIHAGMGTDDAPLMIERGAA